MTIISFILVLFILSFVYTKLISFNRSGILSCGLCGFSGNNPDYNAIKVMWIDNEARGTHSSGVATVKHTNKNRDRVFIKKQAGAAKNLSTMGNVNKYLRAANEVLCHTRFATMGAHNEDNAHPYMFSGDKGDSVIGTHNGWLIDWGRAPKNLDHHSVKDFSSNKGYPTDVVDSMVIFRHIYETQNPSSFSEIEGSMALAFVFKGYLYLYRRQSKPLYAISKKEGIYYSSRTESFEKAFGEEDAKRSFMLENNVLYKLRRGKIVEKIPISPPEIEIYMDELPGTFYHRVRPQYNGGNNIASPNYSNIYDDEFELGGYNGSQYSLPPAGKDNDVFKEADGVIDSQSCNFHLKDEFKELIKTNVHNSSIMNVFNLPLYNKATLSCLGFKIKEISPKLKVKPKIIQPNQSIIILSIEDSIEHSGRSLDGFRVAIKDHRSYCSVTKNGKTGIRAPYDLVGKRVTLLIHPPDNFIKTIKGNDFYPTDIYEIDVKFSASQVVEVACRLPFLAFQGEDKTKGLSNIRLVSQVQDTRSKVSPSNSLNKANRQGNAHAGSEDDTSVSKEKTGGRKKQTTFHLNDDKERPEYPAYFDVDYEDIQQLHVLKTSLNDLCMSCEEAYESDEINKLFKAFEEVRSFADYNYDVNKRMFEPSVFILQDILYDAIADLYSTKGHENVKILYKSTIRELLGALQWLYEEVEKYEDNAYKNFNDEKWSQDNTEKWGEIEEKLD